MSDIFIETEKDDYTGGETVKGKVVLELDSPVPARGIRIKFEGFERSYWVVGSGKHRHTYTETRYFFQHENTVWGREPLDTMALMKDALKGIFSKAHYETLEPGRYEYPFEYVLPEGLPGDFESSGEAKIAYEITAYVDIPLKFDIEKVKRLTIYERLDPVESRPVKAEGSKTFLFDADNPLEMSAMIDSNVYLPGDEGRGLIEVTNKSSKNIDALTVSLVQKVHQEAHGRKTSDESTIVLHNIEKPEIPRDTPTSFKFDFVLPEDMYCTVTSASLVKVTYEIDVNADVPWAIDLNVRLPVTIVEEAGFPSGVARKPE